jgi:hypothetical protein
MARWTRAPAPYESLPRTGWGGLGKRYNRECYVPITRTTALATARLGRWHTRELCAKADGHNPHKPPRNPIEESKRHHDHFPIRELREFRDDAAGVGKFHQSPEHRFRFFRQRIAAGGLSWRM